jgi:hypothetical protein
VQANTCTVTLNADRNVVVTFDPLPRLQLRLPSRYVLHAPYDLAKMSAYAALGSKPLKGVKVRVKVTCAGQHRTLHRGKTNKKGMFRFSEGRDMPNPLRVLQCRVTAKASYQHRKLNAKGRLRFIHPYWLKVASQSRDGSHVVIDVFARPGWKFYAYVNNTRVAKGKTHKNGWVHVSLPTARPGDFIWLAGINHHAFSHVLTLGRTPGAAYVHPDHKSR